MPSSDVCFNGASFWVIASVTSVFTGTISALFGFLMLSWKGRIEAAEKREAQAQQNEQVAYQARDLAVRQRDEASWRLEDTRGQYRAFVEERYNTRPALPRSGE
jgi:hypothetical protein